jgi:hypothetical protein
VRFTTTPPIRDVGGLSALSPHRGQRVGRAVSGRSGVPPSTMKTQPVGPIPPALLGGDFGRVLPRLLPQYQNDVSVETLKPKSRAMHVQKCSAPGGSNPEPSD